MTDQAKEALCSRVTRIISGRECPKREDRPLFDLRNERFFSQLLENFVHFDFSEAEAIEHWLKILDHAETLERQLGRSVGIHLAIVDYFTNVNHVLASPILVEVHVFRQAEMMAMIDPLTGVFNRRYMDEILKKEFNRCGRYANNLSVCLLDIDNFKSLNDTQGHQFGDQVLRELASFLKASIREEDIVCRYGGEEFLIILPETDGEGAGILANRILHDWKNRAFSRENGGITFSTGIASYPASANDVVSLVNMADRSLYQAKFNGKDQVIIAGAERRRFGRFAENWAVAVYTSPESAPITGITTQNISLGGVQFDGPIKYSIDDPLHLVFTNPDPDAPELIAEGRISWVKKYRGTYRYGVSFTEIPELLETKFSRRGVESGKIQG
jgi:diguanylate cyclase (GGDEF)-like protein